MPVMGGFEATGLIRKYEAKEGVPKTPIIALTAHAMIGDKERSLAAGVCIISHLITTTVVYSRGLKADVQMSDHVTKPLRRGELLASIANNLNPSKSGPSSSNLVELTPIFAR